MLVTLVGESPLSRTGRSSLLFTDRWDLLHLLPIWPWQVTIMSSRNVSGRIRGTTEASNIWIWRQTRTERFDIYFCCWLFLSFDLKWGLITGDSYSRGENTNTNTAKYYKISNISTHSRQYLESLIISSLWWRKTTNTIEDGSRQ